MASQVVTTGPIRRTDVFPLCGDSDVQSNWIAPTSAAMAALPYVKPGDTVDVQDGALYTWKVLPANTLTAGDGVINGTVANVQFWRDWSTKSVTGAITGRGRLINGVLPVTIPNLPATAVASVMYDESTYPRSANAGTLSWSRTDTGIEIRSSNRATNASRDNSGVSWSISTLSESVVQSQPSGAPVLPISSDASIPNPASGTVALYFSTNQNAIVYKDSSGDIHGIGSAPVIPTNAITINGSPLTINGQYITVSDGQQIVLHNGAPVLLDGAPVLI